MSNKFKIVEMTLEMNDEVTEMRLQSWLDTYVSDEFGVTREWIEQRNAIQRSEEKRQSRMDRFARGKADGTFSGWVALDVGGKIIGSVTPLIDESGEQQLGSLYVDKAWHGTGVGADLMQEAMGWFDSSKPVSVGVVVYNERAKAFYRKWGFAEVPDSEELFDNLIPEVKMIKETDK